uniref:Uncharacterized protein n=1 Tax=Monopterus albus TaxID=43700 RepID=A0A3Q3PYU4_MONAL
RSSSKELLLYIIPLHNMPVSSLSGEPRRLDLTYITERIITTYCPPECTEETYMQNLHQILLMLQSKHGHNYMLINLSQNNDALTHMNHKVLDTGWVDFLAPNLDQMFSVCTMMENWLQTNLKHILVLHNPVVQLNILSLSADLSLDHFAMRRFYNDKLSGTKDISNSSWSPLLCICPSFLIK